MHEYTGIVRNKEDLDLIIAPKDSFFPELLYDSARVTLAGIDSLIKEHSRPPSADTSENFIFSIPHIDELKIPFSEHAAVDSQIQMLTVGRFRKNMPGWMERSSRWFPLMSEIAEREGMPNEILVLTFIESSLNPIIESHKKAVGLWQFMYPTGLDYGLNKRQSIWVDERRDPVKSTRAAMRYLRDLYIEFGDWYLALCAYNWGWGNVRRALKQINKENPTYWDIRNQKNIKMPTEARNYVPLFLAVLQITSDPAKYGIDVTKINYEPEFKFDIVEIEQPSNLSAIAQAIGVGVTEIRELNPELLYDITPPDRKLYRLRVPPGSSRNFAANFSKLPLEIRQPSLDYTVKKDETIVSVSEKFDVSIDELIALNSLSSQHIGLSQGAKLRIPIGGKTYIQSNLIMANNQLVPKSQLLSTDRNFYVSITTECIYDIAQKHNLNSAQIRNWNDIPIDQDSVEEGKVLIISHTEAEKLSRNKQNSSSISTTSITNTTTINHFNDDEDDTRNSSQNATFKTTTYSVQAGDNLYRIALNHNTTEDALKELNPTIKDNKIFVGQILIVPTINITTSSSSNRSTSTTSNKTTTQTKSSSTKPSAQYHTVVSGDTLSKIARKYNTNINSLVNLNKNINPDVLSLGQKIRVK